MACCCGSYCGCTSLSSIPQSITIELSNFAFVWNSSIGSGNTSQAAGDLAAFANAISLSVPLVSSAASGPTYSTPGNGSVSSLGNYGNGLVQTSSVVIPCNTGASPAYNRFGEPSFSFATPPPASTRFQFDIAMRDADASAPSLCNIATNAISEFEFLPQSLLGPAILGTYTINNFAGQGFYTGTAGKVLIKINPLP
jgi:hypothetical protein